MVRVQSCPGSGDKHFGAHGAHAESDDTGSAWTGSEQLSRDPANGVFLIARPNVPRSYRVSRPKSAGVDNLIRGTTTALRQDTFAGSDKANLGSIWAALDPKPSS